MTNTNRRIRTATTGQLGIVTRQQAAAVGVSTAQLRRRVQSGTLDRNGPNSYRLPGASTTDHAALRGLLLDVDQAWASGPTAAAVHGFDGYRLRPPFDFTVRRGRDVQRVGHRAHTAKRLELIDLDVVDDIPVLSGARTLIDLARTEGVEQLVSAFDSGLRDGLFNEDLLHRRIVALRSSGRYGIPQLLEAIETHEFGAGGHSWLERRFLQLAAAAGLPRPLTQQCLTRAKNRVVRVDFRFPGTDLVVEVLGYRYHRTTDQIARDTERMNALVADGYRVFQFTYDAIVSSPDDVIGTIRIALAA